MNECERAHQKVRQAGLRNALSPQRAIALSVVRRFHLLFFAFARKLEAQQTQSMIWPIYYREVIFIRRVKRPSQTVAFIKWHVK